MGSVVLSIDAELGWGHHDLDDPPPDRVEAGRDGWRLLVDALDEYEIPATWAVVGHLFLADCDGHHADHPLAGDWFEHERNRWRGRPDLRFGPSLIEAVANADVDHEIGCHTFSHVEFGHASDQVARAELVASLRAAAALDVDTPMRSVVFPRNSVGHRDVLAEWGFDCYRGTAPTVDGALGGRLHKITRATVDTPPIVTPSVDEYGLVDVPASLYLYGFEGPARRLAERVWDDPIVRAVERGLDALADVDGVFHLWLHPNNLVGDAEIVRLRRVLEAVARRRDDGDVRIETMQDVAKRLTTPTVPASDPQ
ncbi:polysaccharide deacetylase family protein [Halorubrum sp. JWXQ-INN 858]|uniref:polysaccharide deacetylase family protein n=1 Tax=Halorubrum sp. JWXQ-INN 858 TaxID=2690782 RepID=UPI0013F9B1B9|nr:polysaccharide deacetylase family protein [Halorubrum sp. JWXQ-INN 858]MWV65478.1 polysaccharide deacetylase family protein [Halorubrum sp. JWXQ-INN 858]